MKFTIVHRNEAPKVPQFWAIWIPKKGWLHNDNGLDIFVTDKKWVAKFYARLSSTGAKVYPYDESLKDFERYFKAVEEERAKSPKGK